MHHQAFNSQILLIMDDNFQEAKIYILEESAKSKPIDPNTTKKRYITLFFACLICVGSYFCYHNPAALEKKLKSVYDI
jgi:hypothetical protein